jgi:hypothetical protein
VLPGGAAALGVALTLAGLAQSATTPLLYELCAELTYPGRWIRIQSAGRVRGGTGALAGRRRRAGAVRRSGPASARGGGLHRQGGGLQPAEAAAAVRGSASPPRSHRSHRSPRSPRCSLQSPRAPPPAFWPYCGTRRALWSSTSPPSSRRAGAAVTRSIRTYRPVASVRSRSPASTASC